ncbi:M14 family metallopeptidase [Micromonospora sp. NPDC049301]|uniref:M14 family metallopeptidase n=1 Tax=Micromonospora sp. NPDC049301 TaxID=3155723 RepID=UPI0034343426
MAKGGKGIAWVDFGIHSTEVAGHQTAPQFAYDLVTSETSEAREIRDNLITLLVPNVNPDGGTKVAEWYRQNLGGPYQDAGYPELYQKYAGHDNNRDWYMFNLQETQNVGRQLFHEWIPQVMHNVHQTAVFPARISIPPYEDPLNPNIHPQVVRGVNIVGDAMGQRLEREGKGGALARQSYDIWWNGGATDRAVLPQSDRHSDRDRARLGDAAGLRPGDLPEDLRGRHLHERALGLLPEPLEGRRVAPVAELRLHQDRLVGDAARGQ